MIWRRGLFRSWAPLMGLWWLGIGYRCRVRKRFHQLDGWIVQALVASRQAVAQCRVEG